MEPGEAVTTWWSETEPVSNGALPRAKNGTQLISKKETLSSKDVSTAHSYTNIVCRIKECIADFLLLARKSKKKEETNNNLNIL
jgi:hypothetical protein